MFCAKCGTELGENLSVCPKCMTLTGYKESPILVANGENGQIELYSHRIDITRKGFNALIAHGLDGTKTIFISQLAGLQYFDEGNGGYIQFIFPGSLESKKGLWDALKDENTVTFSKKQSSQFQAIKAYIFQNK